MKAKIEELHNRGKFCYNSFNVFSCISLYLENKQDFEEAIKISRYAVRLTEYIELLKKIVFDADKNAFFELVEKQSKNAWMAIRMEVPNWNHSLTFGEWEDVKVSIFPDVVNMFFESSRNEEFVLAVMEIRKKEIPIFLNYRKNIAKKDKKLFYSESQYRFAKHFIENNLTISEVVKFNYGGDELWEILGDSYSDNPEVFANNLNERNCEPEIPDKDFTNRWFLSGRI